MRPLFDKRVLLQFGAALALWLVVILVSHYHLHKLRNDKGVERSYAVLLHLKDIYSDVENIESAERAFILSGEQGYLAAYPSLIADINRLNKQIHLLTEDNPAQLERFNHFESLISEKISIADQSIALRKESGLEAARDFCMSHKGKQISEAIKSVEKELEHEEYRLFNERLQKESSANNWTILVLNTGRLIAFWIILIAAIRTSREIAIRRAAEQAAKESEGRLNFALESAQMGSWDLDLINDTAIRSLRHDQIFGYKELQPRWGKEIFLQHILPEDLDGVIKAFEAAFKEGMLKLDCRIIWPDGSIHWIFAQGRVYRNEQGEAVRMLGVVVDNTDRKLAERELIEVQSQIKEAQMFLDSIIENIPKMIFVKDAAQLRFIRFNKAGEDLIGVSRREMIGKNDYDFFPKEQADFFTQKDRETLAKGEAVDIPEETIETKKGTRILHTKKVTLCDEKGNPKYLLGISDDVTDIKLAEKQLKETLIDLERSNKELEQFAYVASHDLQEPLRMVASFCQLLEKRYKDKLDDKAREYISYAVDGSIRMQTMVDDLLSYARVGRKNEKASVNLNKVVETIRVDLKIPIEKNHAVLNISLLPTVFANNTQMFQLFQNLLHNALKFRSLRDPVINVSAEKKGNYWEFTVSDNGIGIARQYFEKIFIIFKQLHSKKMYAGTGIGLALCKKIVESHGGQIWLESEPGQGTSFYFTLPIKR